ncbi:MAG: Zn-dependent oligopeptidase [Candidatus Pacebacteria bacterium]|jgi:Zn-dependent oligopeptidase|nr:Zn-dependent oligopeptidase [Candidatus Paceibacterota bacterium]
MQRIPYTPKDFNWTKWTATDIKALVLQIISEKKARLAAIKNEKSPRNFENTIYALEASSYGLTETILKIDLLQNVSTEKSIRDTAKKAVEDFEKQMIRVERDPKIWGAIKEYEQGLWKKEKTHLSIEDKKLFRDTYLAYKRMGFDLTPAKQKRVKEIEERLTKVGSDFQSNITNYKDHIVVSKEEAMGLPERYLSGLKQDKKGNYLVSLDYPDLIPFMELCTNEAKRKELNSKNFQKGGAKNMKVLAEMLKLRAERASLLGYKHHADYQTELRMAKSGKVAFDFELNLLNKVAKSGRSDLDELRDLKRELTKNPKAEIFSHDVAYYGNELQKRRFNFSNEEMREYFPIERALGGAFNIYATLFGVKFEKQDGFPLWHPDAELYAVKTAKGDIVSYFAIDLHPREGKRGHASAHGVIDGHLTTLTQGNYVVPFATIICNFTKPTKKTPSLLSHGEVETFLHEFGHIMHFTLTSARYASQAGYNTAWDFVEAPSQMLEHWAWNKKSLALLSSHYKTGKPIPEKLLKNLIASEDHLLRYSTLRQTLLGIFDLTLHTSKKKLEPAKLWRDMIKKYTGMTLPKDAIFPAGFGHLNDYGAGYYSYLWSKVYAADMFTRFEKEGILNKKTGADYKKWILEKGGSMEEIELVKGFLGRKPSNKAFLKEIGIK